MIDPRFPNFTLLPGSSRVPPISHRPPREPLLPLVQVASVARGRVSTLHDTLRSLQDQTLVRWIWVIVDRTDGSTRARDVMERLWQEPRVRVVLSRPDEVGASLGIAAQGNTPYLCFLRPGDLLEPTALETWAWALETTPAVVAVTSGVVRFGAAQSAEEVLGLGSGGRPGDRRPPAVLFMTRRPYEEIGGIDPTWSANEEIEALSVTLQYRAGHHIGVLPAHHVWRRVHDPADPRGPVFGHLAPVVLRLPPRLPPRLVEDPPFENPLEGDGRGCLFVVPYMFHGGAERVALDQAAVLAARGWRITIVALGRIGHTWRSAFTAVTADVHVAHEISAAWGDWDRTASDLPRFLSYLVASRGIDVAILGATMAGYGVAPWLRQRHPHLAVVAVRHATDWPLLSLDSAPLLDAVLVSTESLVREHRELDAPPDRVHRIVTGIDVEKWRPDPERRGTIRRWLELPPGAPVLVYSSRLSADKQPLVFAETVAMLRKRGLDVYAIVTGDGSERLSLSERLNELGIADRVRLLGEIEDRLMPGIVACGDVAFLPSQREGIALSLLEGMACGLPFVGTSASSQDEVITDDVGALVPPSDPATEARAYTEVLARMLGDREALAEMSRRARARIDGSWSQAQMGDQIEAALNDAIVRAHHRDSADDPEVLARCLAAASIHSVCVDMCATMAIHTERMASVLARLGYDSVGRPLGPGSGDGITFEAPFDTRPPRGPTRLP